MKYESPHNVLTHTLKPSLAAAGIALPASALAPAQPHPRPRNALIKNPYAGSMAFDARREAQRAARGGEHTLKARIEHHNRDFDILSHAFKRLTQQQSELKSRDHKLQALELAMTKFWSTNHYDPVRAVFYNPVGANPTQPNPGNGRGRAGATTQWLGTD
jgi:hypothetical protein